MFDVKLVDIGGDGLVTDVSYMIDTLATVEILIEGLLNAQLGVHSVRLEHVDELVYDVKLNGHDIGVVSIKDVNAAPKGVTNETDAGK